ncbi:alpha/beta hydrolase [Vagococcus elongatus]|uniref:Alpha/beta hydrolase fold-3 domain-containing protein n=1 Tax=Vagococcus elongatus TaxID=180344 RepID=A0A430B1T0_9ENTE|nr:alpha/beta hydrolase [Vagococcus elongatus]RSU14297.1 hypothetical protein CBF29_03070 [Vagococcus elongatus]
MPNLILFASGIFLLGAVIVLSVTSSLTLSVKVLDFFFRLTKNISCPERFQLERKNIKKIADVSYTSQFKNHQADIYYPDEEGPFPVLFWIHGGGFISGGKENVEEFAVYLANAGKIAVVAMGYELAPSSTYPGQLKQTKEMFDCFYQNQEKFPMLDFSQLLFGGDSAGAQIAAQFIITQTNAAYGKKIGMSQVLPAHVLKGAILCCGPYDLKQMTERHQVSFIQKFLADTVAWALLGTKKWQQQPELLEASLLDKVTKDFPPSYITDGNSFSFSKQGMALVQVLNKLDVPVTSLFYEDYGKSVKHDYQFDFTTEEAKVSFEKTVQFIQKVFERDV